MKYRYTFIVNCVQIVVIAKNYEFALDELECMNLLKVFSNSYIDKVDMNIVLKKVEQYE